MTSHKGHYWFIHIFENDSYQQKYWLIESGIINTIVKFKKDTNKVTG
jgi:hypothetical protein